MKSDCSHWNKRKHNQPGSHHATWRFPADYLSPVAGRAGVPPKRKKFRAADLFCGAGGTSAGLVEACADLNLNVELTAINHWDVAIATHAKNHPGTRHLCTSLDVVNPRDLYQEGELKILWASPECTHHSVARGGKPVRDQSRATAWCVVRWAEALRPDVILVENVKEFRGWGPLIRKRVFDKKKNRNVLAWVPDPKRKGEIFHSWVKNLEAIGYRVEHRVLCAADYGDPTTRERLFVQCVRKGSRYKLCWPNATHTEHVSDQTADGNLFGLALKPWVPAREIIDWSLKGQSIFTRKKSLADNTLRRIFIGLERFGLKDFIVPQQRFDNVSTDSVDQPLRTITGGGGRLFNLIQPKVKPAIVKLRGTNNAADPGKPMPTVTAGGNHLGVMEPCLVEVNHGKNSKTDNHRVRSTGKPLPPVTTRNGQALCEFVMQTDQTGGNGACVRSPGRPLATVITKQNVAVVGAELKPFILPREGVHRGNAARSTEQPLPTVTTNGGGALAEPKLTPLLVSAGGPKRDARPTNKPVQTVTCKDSLGVAEPYLVPFHGERHKQESRSHSLNAPVPTVACSPTLGLAEPIVVKFYGSGIAKPVSSTLDAVTTKERFGLAQPILEQLTAAVRAGRKPILEINGQQYVLDILFRMLNWRELGLAQGFRADYQFTGNTEEVVKQIGNAVPRNLARALVKAVLSQNPNVA